LTWLLRRVSFNTWLLSDGRVAVCFVAHAAGGAAPCEAPWRREELASPPAAAASAAQVQDVAFVDGLAIVRFVAHAAVGAELCEGAPTKTKACEPPCRCRFIRRGFRVTAVLRFVSPLSRLSVKRCVKALLRSGEIVSLHAAAASAAQLQNVALGRRPCGGSFCLSCCCRCSAF